jgi:hypothetical protein
VVAAVLVAVVFGLARLLGSSSDGSSKDAGPVTQVAASPAGSLTSGKSPGPGGVKPARLAVPDGPCSDDEVILQPVPGEPEGGSEVVISLNVYSGDSAACTFRVSSESIVVKLTSGDDFIWSSQDCPASVPSAEVVARRSKPARVDVRWSGRRSDAECRPSTQWVEPGWYHAIAAALGGEPTDVQFRLSKPPVVTITKTASPTQQPTEPASQSTGESTGEPAQQDQPSKNKTGS